MQWSDRDTLDVSLIAAEGPVPGPHEYVMLVGREVRKVRKKQHKKPHESTAVYCRRNFLSCSTSTKTTSKLHILID